jgi:hypothetical protein
MADPPPPIELDIEAELGCERCRVGGKMCRLPGGDPKESDATAAGVVGLRLAAMSMSCWRDTQGGRISKGGV